MRTGAAEKFQVALIKHAGDLGVKRSELEQAVKHAVRHAKEDAAE
ncbi:hypothetical protein ABZ646_40170 [Streptomyces sp. NPDC007162]